MARSPLTPHDRHSVLVVGRRAAEALAAAALDPASGLPEPVRASLAAIVVEVDLAAHRRAGVEPPSADLRARLDCLLPATPEARPPPIG